MPDPAAPAMQPVSWRYSVQPNGQSLATFLGDVAIDGVANIGGQITGWVSVRDFGAVGDGVTDDTAAIQAALNASRPLASVPASGVILHFPAGNYLVSAPLTTWSGIVLEGSLAGSTLTGAAGLADHLLGLASADASGYYMLAGVRLMTFNTGPGIWAIKALAADVVNSVFQDLVFYSEYCLNLGTYTQACQISRIHSRGAVDQILLLTGNFNLIDQFDKEGATGSTADPYVLLINAGNRGASGNQLLNILLEGAGVAAKVPLVLNGAKNTIITNYWMEATNLAGPMLQLIGSQNVELNGVLVGPRVTPNLQSISVTANSSLYIDRLDGSGAADWHAIFAIDATSAVRIGTLILPRNENQWIAGAAANLNLQVGQVENLAVLNGSFAGFPVYGPADFLGGQNLFVNPSFEAGVYGWTFNASQPDFSEVIASEIGWGLELHAQSAAGFQLRQSLVIPASLVGCPITLRYAARCSAGNICPLLFSGAPNITGTLRIDPGTAMNVVEYTAVIQAAGTFNFGLQWVGLPGGEQDLWVDEMTLTFGAGAAMNPAKVGSFELNGVTQAAAIAAPTTGTWKRGDHVWNSSPAVGAPKGWFCTVAGTPGTWVADSNL